MIFSIPTLYLSAPKKLIGKRMQMSLVENKTAELWQSFMPFRNQIQHTVSKDLVSMQLHDTDYFKDFQPTKLFEKWASVEVTDFTSVPENMESYEFDGGLYAIFDYKGSSADTRIFQYIFGTWLPQSEYELDQRPQLEILGERYKNNSQDSEEEIWIPIKPKI